MSVMFTDRLEQDCPDHCLSRDKLPLLNTGMFEQAQLYFQLEF